MVFGITTKWSTINGVGGCRRYPTTAPKFPMRWRGPAGGQRRLGHADAGEIWDIWVRDAHYQGVHLQGGVHHQASRHTRVACVGRLRGLSNIYRIKLFVYLISFVTLDIKIDSF